MANESLLPPEIEEYSRRLVRDPHSLVFAQLADAYRRHNMLDEAVETCLQGLRIHPDYVSARLVLGRAYRQKNMLDEAKAEFLKVLEVNPDHVLVRNFLADIYLQEGEYVQAKEEYEKVLSIDPENATAREGLSEVNTRLATLAAEGKSPEKAAPGTTEIPSESVKEPEVPTYISSFSLEDLSSPDREERFRPPISFSEEVEKIFGETELVTGKAEEAEKAEEKEMAPEETEEKEMATGKAEVSFTLSDSTPPEFATLTLAEIYLKQGLLQEAIQIYQRILKEDPDNTVARAKLEELLSRQVSEEEELVESTFIEKEVPAEEIITEAPPKEEVKPSWITEEVAYPKEEVVTGVPPTETEESVDRLRHWLERLRTEESAEKGIPPSESVPEEKVVMQKEEAPSPEKEIITPIREETFAGASGAEASLLEMVRKLASIQGVKATLIIGKDGEVKAQFFRGEGIPGLKEGNPGEILRLAEQLANLVGGKEVRYTLLETPQEKIFLSSAGEDLIVVVTGPDVHLGWVRLEICRIKELLARS